MYKDTDASLALECYNKDFLPNVIWFLFGFLLGLLRLSRRHKLTAHVCHKVSSKGKLLGYIRQSLLFT